MARHAALCLVTLLGLAAATVTLAAAPPPPPPKPPGATPVYATFYAGISKRKDLTILKQAVDRLGLANTFKNPQLAITAFVPSDAAFKALALKIKISPAALLSQGKLLKNVLYYHMLPKPIRTGAMAAGSRLPTLLAGQSLTVAAAGMKPKLQGVGSSATVYLPNIKCGAGLAHAINYPLLPLKI